MALRQIQIKICRLLKTVFVFQIIIWVKPVDRSLSKSFSVLNITRQIILALVCENVELDFTTCAAWVAALGICVLSCWGGKDLSGIIPEWSFQYLEVFWECDWFLKGEFVAVTVPVIHDQSQVLWSCWQTAADINSYFQTYNLDLSEKYFGLLQQVPLRYSLFLCLSCAVDPRPYLPPLSKYP